MTPTPLDAWIAATWIWVSALIVPVSTIMFIAAGYLIMASAGNPDRIKLAKQIIYSNLSGIALIILSYLLITVAMGIPITLGSFVIPTP